MAPQPFKMVQISDAHLMADAEGSLLGVKTLDSYQAVVERVREKEGHVDLVLLSGDLSQDGSKTSYEYIENTIKTLNAPVYFIPGNHDDFSVMNQIFPSNVISSEKHIVLKDWQLILLNSQIPGAVEGYLNAEQLKFLQTCLKKYPTLPAIVAFHHHPIPMGVKWLDNLGVRNADEFWKVAAGFPNIKFVLFGHVHQEFKQEVEGIPCFGVPSTCIQFKPKQEKFGLDYQPPGYRWVQLYQDGRFETGIQRTENYIGIFDENADGY